MQQNSSFRIIVPRIIIVMLFTWPWMLLFRQVKLEPGYNSEVETQCVSWHLTFLIGNTECFKIARRNLMLLLEELSCIITGFLYCVIINGTFLLCKTLCNLFTRCVNSRNNSVKLLYLKEKSCYHKIEAGAKLFMFLFFILIIWEL